MKDWKKYESNIPESFKSDGCTFAPDGKWGSCCVIHDHAKLNKNIKNKDADKMLLNCMKERANPVLAYLYYFFVRIKSITNLAPFEIMSYTVISLVIILISIFA